LFESATGLVVSMPSLDLSLDLADPSVEQLEVLEQSLDKLPECARQIIRRIFDQIRHTQGDVGNALRHNEAVLAQQATDLGGLSGASLHEALAHAVQ